MRTRVSLAAVLAATALAAGCGSSSSSPPTSQSSTGGETAGPPATTQPPASTTQPPASTTQSSGGSSTGTSGTVPKKTTAKPQGTKMGSTIVITPTGFSPGILLAPLGPTITWENESGSVQSVHLDNFGSRVDSGPIQPGHVWAFNPHAALSIVYHSTYRPSFQGQLQVQAVGNY